jgi:GMP synthase (glutamine-hydrolysing)
MTAHVLLLDHPLGQRDDRVSARLAASGYPTTWCCPGKGDSLPDAGSRFDAAVVYGGPESANDGEDKAYIRQEIDFIGRWVGTGKPFLGICLGGQMLARALGARVAPHPEGDHEIGYTEITPTEAGRAVLPAPLQAFQWHKEGFEVPAGATLLAEAGGAFPNQAFRYGAKAYGLQFHPEVTIPVMNRWIQTASHMLTQPGAHSAERQRSDSQTHDAPLATWLDSFLAHWLDGAR